MRKNKDMYINYTKTTKKKGKYENNRGPKNIIPIVAIIVVIFVVGGGSLFLYKGGNILKNRINSPSTDNQITTKDTENDVTANNLDNNNTTNDDTNGEINNDVADNAKIDSDETNNNVANNDITNRDEVNDELGDSNGIDNTNTNLDNTESNSNVEQTGENANKENEDQETMPVESTNVQSEDNDNSKSGSIADNQNEVNDSTKAIKGIYVTGPRAGMSSYMDDLIDLVDRTEINAMVIDIKNDSGEITYKMELPMVEELGAGVNYIKDINELVKRLKEKNIYLIARIVSFKDPILAKGKKELSLKKKDGSYFVDKNGDRWVNPYKTEVWDYLVSIGKEAANLGFDEIQFDYIRFSTDTGMKDVDYGAIAANKTKIDIITEFTKYACDNLQPLGVKVSADVYGTIIDSKVDAAIVGQDYEAMSQYLDYICPMIYPSHYQNGAYGIEFPDMDPYGLIFNALSKSKDTLGGENDSNHAIVRPWLQDFTASWLSHHITYGAEEIRDQIQAVYDTGYGEWILWNGNNNYTEDGLLKE